MTCDIYVYTKLGHISNFLLEYFDIVYFVCIHLCLISCINIFFWQSPLFLKMLFQMLNAHDRIYRVWITKMLYNEIFFFFPFENEKSCTMCCPFILGVWSMYLPWPLFLKVYNSNKMVHSCICTALVFRLVLQCM